MFRLILTAGLLSVCLMASTVNVAPSGTITVTAGSVAGAPLAVLNDGRIVSAADPDAPFVWWTDESTVLRVDLPKAVHVTGLAIDAGVSTAWRVDVLRNNWWVPVWRGVFVQGATLPDISFATFDIYGSSFRVYASKLDGNSAMVHFSFSEIQILTNAPPTETPEPPWPVLVGPGLALILLARRRAGPPA